MSAWLSELQMDGWLWPLGQSWVAWLALGLVLATVGSYGLRSWGLSYFLRGSLLVLRFTAIAVMVMLLAGPARWVSTPAHAVLPKLVILEDVSGSMNQKDVAEAPGLTRSEMVKRSWLQPTYLAELSKWANIEHIQFDQEVRSVTHQPRPHSSAQNRVEGTNLYGAVSQAIGSLKSEDSLSDQAIHAAQGLVLVLSDGHDTVQQNHQKVMAQLSDRQAPVFVVPVGEKISPADIAIMAWPENDTVLRGQLAVLHASILQHGFDGQSTTVSLWHDGVKVESRQVQFNHRPNTNAPINVRFEVRPELSDGRSISVEGYELRIDPLPGELRFNNNRRWVFLKVSRERIRVVMFEGQPYWDTRFLAQTLSQDDQIALTTIYGLGSGRALINHEGESESEATSAAFPWSLEELSHYDVIILGKNCEQFFTGDSASRLVDFVRKQGGALVLARGRAFDTSTDAGAKAQTLLEPLEPVVWGEGMVEDLKLDLTPVGRRSPLLAFDLPETTDTMLAQLPDMMAATRIDHAKAASLVLLTQQQELKEEGQRSANGKPWSVQPMAALVHQQMGTGQVLAVLSQGLWQWAFLPSSLKQYDSVYQMFWSKTMRWLVGDSQFLPGQFVSLSLSRLQASPGQDVMATVTARYVGEHGLKIQVEAIAPDGQKHQVPMTLVSEQANRYTGRWMPDQSGVWTVELHTPGIMPETQRVRFAVDDQSIEQADPSSQFETLAELAKVSGGQVLNMNGQADLMAYLKQIAVSQQAGGRLVDDHARVWMIVVLFFCLGLEWVMRKRMGLP